MSFKSDEENITSSSTLLSSSPDYFIHVISTSEGDSPGYNSSLREILERVPNESSPPMTIFEAAGHGVFFLCTSRCSIHSTNGVDESLLASQQFIEKSKDRQICIAYQGEFKKKNHGPFNKERCSILIVLARYHRDLLPSLGLPATLHQQILQRQIPTTNTSKFGSGIKFFIKGAIWCTIAVVAVLVVLFAFPRATSSSHPPSDIYHTWIQYPTHQSVGPKYQLPITATNASAFASYLDAHGPWTLRIDDQALVPTSLIDSEELHYQAYLQTRYPEMTEIRVTQSYINETWLSSPLRDQVPADDAFHFSHCVLAVKRYIKAKKTGKHVCGRDIDEEHVQHCLDSLDWWAFPKGKKRGDDMKNPKQDLWWRTKVCFD